MLRRLPFVVLLIAAACLIVTVPTGAQRGGQATPLPPGFKPAPEVPAMPVSD